MRKFATLLRWGYFVLSEIIGFGGYPDDAKTWGRWLAMLEPILDIPAVRVLLIASGGIVLTYPQWLPYIRRIRVKQDSVFDVSIKEALWLLWENVEHTYDSSGRADRFFLRLLHKKMCSGDLPVVGRLGRGGNMQLISPAQCQRLIPMEIVVPINPTALQGVSFVLSPSETRTPPSKMFWGLRIRSEDLHQVWPETKVRGGEGGEK